MPPVAVGAAERYVLRVADRTHAGQERFAARRRRLAQARVALRILFRLTDRGERVAPGVLGCAYPRTERSLAALSESGVGLLVNLHERPHDSARLGRHGLREVHLPVKDFAAPSPEQIGRGVGAILEALAAGEAAAVHCGGGLGRTGPCSRVTWRAARDSARGRRSCAFAPSGRAPWRPRPRPRRWTRGPDARDRLVPKS